MNTIFRIKFDLPPGITKRQSPDEVARACEDAAGGLLTSTTDIVLQRLREALMPGGKFNVGATGKASENFIVMQGNEGSGRPFMEIKEGNLTKANYFIWRGSTGHGKPPPYANIREWLIAKRVPLYGLDVTERHREWGYERGKSIVEANRTSRERSRLSSTYARAAEQVRYTRPHRGRPVRPWKRSQPLFEEVLEMIRWSIASKGTSVAALGRPPIGRRYFDYLKYVADRKDLYAKVLERGVGALSQLFLEFALAGRREKGLDPLLQKRFRYRTYV